MDSTLVCKFARLVLLTLKSETVNVCALMEVRQLRTAFVGVLTQRSISLIQVAYAASDALWDAYATDKMGVTRATRLPSEMLCLTQRQANMSVGVFAEQE